MADDKKPISPKLYDILEEEKKKINIEGSRIQQESPYIGLNAQGFGESKYDEKASIKDIEEGLLNRTRATYQSGLEGVANTALAIVPKIGLGILETAGNILDLENYVGALGLTKTDYDNWFSQLARQGSEAIEEELPVYLQKPGQAFDPTDSAWWIKNIGGVVESAAEFGLTGAGIGKGLGAGVNALKAINSPVAKAMVKGLNTIGQPLATVSLTHAEGVLTGQQVYQDVYNKQLELTNDPIKASQIAADAASTSVRLNYINTALNYTSLSPFFRSSNISSKLVSEELKRLPSETAEQYLKRVKTSYNPSLKRTLNTIKKESAQEAGEEWINIIAQNEGLYQGGAKTMEGTNFFERAIESATSEEGLVSAGLGAFGGTAQTAFTTQLSKKDIPQIQKSWKAQRQAIVDNFGEDGINLSKDIKEAGILQNELKKAIVNKDEVQTNFIKNKLADLVDYRNIKTGTTKDLESRYDEMLQKTFTQEGIVDLINQGIVESDSQSDINNLRTKINDRKQTLVQNENLYNSLEFNYSGKLNNQLANDRLLYNLFDTKSSYNSLLKEYKKLNNEKINLANSLQEELSALNIKQDNFDNLFNPLDLSSYSNTYSKSINRIKSLDSFKELEKLDSKTKDISEAAEELNKEFTELTTEKGLKKFEKEFNKNNPSPEEEAKSQENDLIKTQSNLDTQQEEITNKEVIDNQEKLKKENQLAEEAQKEINTKSNKINTAIINDIPYKSGQKLILNSPEGNEQLVISNFNKDEDNNITSINFKSNLESVDISFDLQEFQSLLDQGLITVENIVETEVDNDRIAIANTYVELFDNKDLGVNEDPSLEPRPDPSNKSLINKERERINFIFDLIERTNLNPKTFTFKDIFDYIKNLPETDTFKKQEVLPRTFELLKYVVEFIQNSPGNNNQNSKFTSLYKLNSDLTISLGEQEDTYKPNTQSNTDKINKDLYKDIRENSVEENVSKGFKIEDILSIARNDIEFTEVVTDDKIIYKDKYTEEGKLIFSNVDKNDPSSPTLNLLNTDLTKIGTKLIFKKDPGYDFSKSSEEYDNNFGISIYTLINNKETYVGKLHNPEYVNSKKMAEKLSPEELEEQKNNLINIRKEILNSNVDFESTINYKGYGYVNQNKSDYTNTLRNTFGNDNRILLGVKKNELVSVTKDIDIHGNSNLVNGSVFIVLPHPNGEYLPWYVNKKTLNNDQNLLDNIVKGFETVFITGNVGESAWNYVYITDNPSNQSLSSVYVNKLTKEVWVNNKKFTADQYNTDKEKTLIDLKSSLGNVYINVNEKKLNDKEYIKTLFESPVLQSNVAQNKETIDGKEIYSYFSQVTVNFDNPIKTKKEEKLEETNTKKEEDLLEQEGLSEELFISDENEDITVISDDNLDKIEKEFIENNSLLKDIPIDLQNEMVDSISFSLLKNQKEVFDVETKERITNKDLVKKDIEDKLNYYKELNKITSSDTIKKGSQKFINNLQLTLDNYNTLFVKAEEVLKQLGVEKDDTTGFYEEQETLEESVSNWADESSYTEDRSDSASGNVKKFLYFIPELQLTSKGYLPKLNNLGYQKQANYKDIFIKLSEELSRSYYSSNKEGYNDMINTLLTSKDIYLNYIGKELNKSTENIKADFFRAFNQQHAVYKETLNYYTKAVSKADPSGSFITYMSKLFSNTINSDRNSAAKKITKEWLELSKKTTIYNSVHNNITGTKELSVDTNKGKQLYNQLLSIYDNPDNFDKTTFKNDETIVEIIDILKSIGIVIDKQGFYTFLNKHKVGGQQNNKIAFKDIIIDKIFKRLTGELSENNDREFDSLFKYNNPFEYENQSLEILARYQYPYSKATSAAIRSNGKSFYAYVRHTPLSEMFLKLKDKNYLQERLKDIYASNSLYLNELADGNIKFTKNFGISYDKGSKIVSDKNSENKEVQDQIEKEYELTRIQQFQNQGLDFAIFHSDTHSDKTTKVQVTANKQEVNYTGDIGNILLDNNILDSLSRYFYNEYFRILKTQTDNNNPNIRKIKGYHGKSGMGVKFLTYTFFNKEFLETSNPKLAALIYDNEGNLLPVDNSTTKALIKEEINKHFNKIIEVTAKDWNTLGIYEKITDKNKKEQVVLNNFDYKYIQKVAKKLNITNQAVLKNTKVFGNQEINNDRSKIFEYSLVDYVVNYSINSNEMLMLTGDPAQHGKPKNNLKNSIVETFVNVGKRNARLLASGDKKTWDKSEYNVAFVKDTKINSSRVNEYYNLLKDRFSLEEIESIYNDKEESDAQEFTTVEEHLADMKSHGYINSTEEKQLLGKWDKNAFYKKYPNQSISKISDKDYQKLSKIVLQPRKPVQVYSKLEDGINRLYYIKTSSIPLIPELIVGTEMEKVLEAMKTNEVERLAFASGVKLGLTGQEKDLFNKEGLFNPESINTSSIHTLNRDGFSIQLNVPYDESKDQIREGTQLMKLLFTDIPDNTEVEFQGKKTNVKELKKLFTKLHKNIVDKELNKLLKDIGASKLENGKYKIHDISKLSKILIEEGLGRGYSENSLIGLQINPETNTFNIPLTFLNNNSQIEPVITSLLTNRLTKIKLPGKSYVQTSEVVFRRRNIKEITEVSQEDKRNIIWTKPEHKDINKLDYISNVNGKIKKAQILMPSFFVSGNKKINLKEFIKQDGTLDLDKLPEELLTITGFRIPTQARNSMMVFEVIGFLPDIMGDTIIVPSEIAAQMGSDFDVDKLYTYHLGYEYDKESKAIKTVKYSEDNDSSLSSKSGIVEITQAILTTPSVLTSMINPVDFGDLKNAIDDLKKIKASKSKENTEFLGNYVPLYQRKQFFDNKAGKSGVGITANANTSHALSQDANLYIKGTGVLFLDENNNVISDSKNIDKNRVNSFEEDIYKYKVKDEIINQADNVNNGAWRLDKVDTFVTNGKSKKISDIISQWLGASVDNAKEKLLGDGGINNHNFNVGLLIARLGFDDNWIIPFINQPILLEYYKIIDKLNDPTVKNYESGKREKSIKRLFEKYQEKYNVNVLDELAFTGTNLQDLNNNIAEEITENNVLHQLNILKAFLHYEELSTELRTINSSLNTDVKGLPKNITETNIKADKIDNLGLSNGSIGNITKLKNNTVISPFQEIPRIASDLFSTDAQDRFIYHYDTEAYRDSLERIMKLTNSDRLSEEELNEIHSSIYQFVLSGIVANANTIRQDLTIGENNIYDKLIKLKEKPKNLNNYLLDSLNLVSSTNPTDPKKIELISISSDTDVFEQKINKSWTEMLLSKKADGARSEESIFAEELALYTITASSQQYGSSNLLKHLPYAYLEKIGYPKFINGLDFNSDILGNFTQQFIQHKPEYLKLTKESQFDIIIYKENPDGSKSKVIDSFTLPEIGDNKAADLVIEDLTGELVYPQYLSIYSTELKARLPYIKTDNPETIQYIRLDKLGSNNFYEYSFYSENQNTIIESQKANLDYITNPEELPEEIDGLPQDINEEVATNYFTKPTVESVLNSIILDNQFNEDPQAQAYYELANILSKSDINFKVIVDSSIGKGKINNTTKEIRINPNSREFKDSNGNYEKLKIQETYLHELIHAVTISKLNTKEAIAVNNTFKAYQDSIKSKPKDYLDAEIFKVLYENNNQSSEETSLNELLKGIPNEEGLTKFSINIKKITNTKLNVKEISNYITTEFKDNIKENKEKFYAYTNVREFITMSFVNKGTQEYLKSIETINLKTKQKESLWNKFIDAITKLITGKDRTLLNDAIESIIDLIEQTGTESEWDNISQAEIDYLADMDAKNREEEIKLRELPEDFEITVKIGNLPSIKLNKRDC
jgi:hypothetical protein